MKFISLTLILVLSWFPYYIAAVGMSQDIKPGYQDRRAFSKAIIMLLLDLKHSLAPQ